MGDKQPCTSPDIDQPLSLSNVNQTTLWTKSLKNMPTFTYAHIEKHLILENGQLPDKKPADAIKHKKVATGCSRQVLQQKYG